MPGTRAPLSERLWRKVNKQGPVQPHMDTPCWLWRGFTNAGGYGCIGVYVKRCGRGTSVGLKTHRVSWELANGPIPLGRKVLHRCDVPACVNPAHLFLGTDADNSADKVAKMRHKHEFSANLVRAIRAEYRQGGVSVRDLAARHGIGKSSVNYIVNRKRWGHLDKPVHER